MKATLWVSVKYMLERQTKALEDAKLKLSEHSASLSRAQYENTVELSSLVRELSSLVRWAKQDVEAAQDALDAIQNHDTYRQLVKIELEV